MKKIWITALFVALFTTSCSKNEQIKTTPVVETKEIFSTTQQYEIMCWIIKKSESYRAKPYKCEAGVRTVGYGFTHVTYVKNIHHADKIFKQIVNLLFNEVSKEYPTLTYLQKSAICSLLYNTGDLEMIKKSKFSKALVQNDLDRAIANFLDWNKIKIRKGKYKVSKGLTNRREYEAKLLTGEFNMSDYLELKKEIEHIYVVNKTT